MLVIIIVGGGMLLCHFDMGVTKWAPPCENPGYATVCYSIKTVIDVSLCIVLILDTSKSYIITLGSTLGNYVNSISIYKSTMPQLCTITTLTICKDQEEQPVIKYKRYLRFTIVVCIVFKLHFMTNIIIGQMEGKLLEKLNMYNDVAA